jgi:hypothetical protein
MAASSVRENISEPTVRYAYRPAASLTVVIKWVASLPDAHLVDVPVADGKIEGVAHADSRLQGRISTLLAQVVDQDVGTQGPTSSKQGGGRVAVTHVCDDLRRGSDIRENTQAGMSVPGSVRR